ncbi:DMT family transporter [Microvirga sp. VF16]|uniref:DMT family transporter n=1 Tax=Microvirga sp. VF16 TaxID=2807101 RepID=UPI00193E2278|nr:DMT family transporter [Microvirga sp. VF16]QRM32168.1 DMT family transporter [Microvirga sp. VF16]
MISEDRERIGRPPTSKIETPLSQDRPLHGITCLLAAMAVFSCSDAASKLMTETMSAVEVAWLRYCVFSILMLGMVAFAHRRHVLRSKRPSLQVLRGLGLLGSSVFFIVGLAYMPMAEATAISFVSPMIVTALSIPILGEVVGWRRWSAVGIGLLGVLIVVQPGAGAFDPAAIFPLLSALSWAIAMVVTRKMSNSDSPLVSLLYAALVGLLVTSVLVPFTWEAPGWYEISLGFVTGGAFTVAQWLVVLAFQQARASVLAPLSYSQLVWSGLFGYVIFSNVPDGWTLFGTAIIMGSGLYTAHRERAVKIMPSSAQR